MTAQLPTVPSTTMVVPYPFALQDDGVFLRTPNPATGSERLDRICGRLEVLSYTRGFDSTGWGRAVNLTAIDGSRRTMILPASLLSGPANSLTGMLASNGLDLAPDSDLRKLLPDYLLACTPTAFVRQAGQLGWCATDAFVLPSGVLGNPKEDVIVDRNADAGFASSGTLDDWKEAVASPAEGNSRLMLALSLGFVGPLLEWLPGENLGIHLRGRSSTGKTTAAAVAASVWGPGDNRFIRSWRATENALEPLAASRNDNLLVLDEISQAPARVVAEAAYLLMNGQGKARMTRNAESEPTRRWKVVVLSTGETSLSSMLSRGPNRVQAGQEVRLIDLPADAGADMGLFERVPAGDTPNSFARRLGQASTEHYGMAGPAFVERLIADGRAGYDNANQQIGAFVKEYCADDVDGQVRRVAYRFGLAAVAGELAIQYDILPWQGGAAYQAAGQCFRDWLAERESTTAHEATAGIERIRDFLLRYGPTRFTSLDDPDERAAANRVGFRTRTKDGGTDYFIFPAAFRDDICAPLHARDVIKELDTRGFLVKGRGGPSVTKRLPGYGNAIKVYHVRGTVVGDDEDDNALTG
ncbi:DUF927 domain-containing protein [Azospirillum sp. Marseille-Q6669]